MTVVGCGAEIPCAEWERPAKTGKYRGVPGDSETKVERVKSGRK
jgi:hypothetical protein